MTRLAICAVLMVSMLAACGQVIVFGHVVGERPAASAPKSGSTPASQPQSGRPTAAPASQPMTSEADSSKPASPQPAAEPPTVAPVVKAVNLTITPEAREKVTGDASRFSAEDLLAVIKAELKARKLLDEQNPRASGTAEIVVDGLATRPTTNAIVFGYKMLAGTLEGDIRVVGSRSTDSIGSRIVAESKLTVAASGDDEDPLGPLYHRFAVLAADRLAGVVSKPAESTGIPRF